VSDARSRRVAVVADSLLEPLLDELGREGFGIMQLPPTDLEPETAAAWLEQTAEHVAELRRNEYEVVLVDDGAYTERLERALLELGVPPLAQYAIQPPSTSRFTPDT
jgi:serine/threonine protein kinase HipA of HipAB toxin-antitoxin module